MSLLAQLLKKHPVLALASIFASVLLVAITLLWNAQLSHIINTISSGDSLSSNAILPAVATMVAMSAANYLRTYLSGYTCEMLTHDLRVGYAHYFSALPIAEIEQLNAGEQLSKLQNEIADISGYLSGNLFQLIHDAITFIATLGWLLILNPKLTLIVNLPVLLVMLYVFHSSKIISKATERSQQAKGQMNRHADTLLTLFPVIRLYDADPMMLESYSKEVTQWTQSASRAERLRARLMSLSGLLSNIPLMLLFLSGGSMVLSGSLLLGTLYVFLNLSGNVSGVMMNMPGYIASFRQFSTNMTRLSPKIILTGKEPPK